VNGVYLLETAQTMIVIYQSYATFVRSFSDGPPSSAALDVVGVLWIWYFTGGLGEYIHLLIYSYIWYAFITNSSNKNTVTLAVQCLYAYRIYVFGGAMSVLPFAGASLIISVVIVFVSVRILPF